MKGVVDKIHPTTYSTKATQPIPRWWVNASGFFSNQTTPNTQNSLLQFFFFYGKGEKAGGKEGRKLKRLTTPKNQSFLVYVVYGVWSDHEN